CVPCDDHRLRAVVPEGATLVACCVTERGTTTLLLGPGSRGAIHKMEVRDFGFDSLGRILFATPDEIGRVAHGWVGTSVRIAEGSSPLPIDSRKAVIAQTLSDLSERLLDVVLRAIPA